MSGRDIYEDYTAFVTLDGYKSLVQWPSLKAPDVNDWAEEDGIEADLGNPVLDTRNVVLDFAFLSEDGYIQFREALLLTTWREFEFVEIGRRYWLRLVSESGLKTVQGLFSCSFTFADDTPLRDYTYMPPSSDQEESDGYQIDGKDLRDYGIRVLQGTLPEVVSMPAVKEALTVESKYMPGAQYDGGWSKLHLADKSASLHLLMRAETLADLWRNYDAFLYDLVRPGEHMLSAEREGAEHAVYYESCTIEQFHATGKIWLDFTLTLHVARYGWQGSGYILSTEDGREITTADGRTISMEEGFKI